MPSPDLGPRGGKYPNHIVQSILVPKDRKDVRGDPRRARIVAERYGVRPGGKVAEQANYFAFRQYDPAKIQPGSYISWESPGDVILRKGLPMENRENPRESRYVDFEGHKISLVPYSRTEWIISVNGESIGSFKKTSKGLVKRMHHATTQEGSDVANRYLETVWSRENPSSDGSGVWWAVGAATVVLVSAALLTARSASAAPAPNPNNPVPTPRTPPAPRSPTPSPLPRIARQSTLSESSATSSGAIRIMQQQLQQLGYTITHIDGRPSSELSRATLEFENDAGLSHFTSNLELMIAIDARYGHVFDPTNSAVV